MKGILKKQNESVSQTKSVHFQDSLQDTRHVNPDFIKMNNKQGTLFLPSESNINYEVLQEHIISSR